MKEGGFPLIRITILTGFLGAGKTTLLNSLLKDPDVTDTAVIVNEFGEVGIDHLLVEASAGEGIVELSDGCLCCTVRGDLVDTLLRLADPAGGVRARPLRRVVVETTGLADPTPILAALMSHPGLLEAYALDGVITVVDALAGEAALEGREEARRQAAVADRIVLSKTDLAAPEAIASLRARLQAIDPGARFLDAAQGEAWAAALFDCGLFDPRTKSPEVLRWLGAAAEAGRHHHDHHDHDHSGHRHLETIRSFAIERRAPIPLQSVEWFLDLLRATQGERILRMKAVVRTLEEPERPLVLHGVRSYLHPPVRLSRWPAGLEPGSRLVLISENLSEPYVRELFAAFAGEPGTDRPDAAALTDNPLAVPGVSF